MNTPTKASFSLCEQLFSALSTVALCMGLAHAAGDQALPVLPSDNAHPLGLLDAIRLTLAKNPDIQLREKQVELSQGALQQATGQFDPTLRLMVGRSVYNSPLNQQNRNSYASQGFPVSQIRTETTAYNLALDNPLRNGIVLSPSFGVTSTTGTANDFSNLPAQNQGKVDFSIRVPMLKGSGESAAAGEVAANLEWEASKQDLRFLISQSVLNTVTAYWGLLAAGKNLDIVREAEASVRRMVDETRKLIEADELPAADINVVRASLLDKSALRISAEQALLNARQSLGQAVGLPYPQITTLEPSDGFPSLDTELSALESKQQRLFDLAIKHRADLAAAQLRRDSARTLTSAAQNNLNSSLTSPQKHLSQSCN